MGENSNETRVFYFGAIGGPGHYLFRPSSGGYAAVHVYNDAAGWTPGELDTVYPPAVRKRLAPNYVKLVKEAAEGAAALHHVEKNGIDWTILSFWDRSVDRRPGCSSTFLIEGTHDFPGAVAAARDAFPRIWERYTFHVHHLQGEP